MSLSRFRDDLQEILRVFRKMKSEASRIGYTDSDLETIDLMASKLALYLPSVNQAIQSSDPESARSAFNCIMNFHRSYVIDFEFGGWSDVWQDDGLAVMHDAAAISMKATDLLRKGS